MKRAKRRRHSWAYTWSQLPVVFVNCGGPITDHEIQLIRERTANMKRLLSNLYRGMA